MSFCRSISRLVCHNSLIRLISFFSWLRSLIFCMQFTYDAINPMIYLLVTCSTFISHNVILSVSKIAGKAYNFLISWVSTLIFCIQLSYDPMSQRTPLLISRMYYLYNPQCMYVCLERAWKAYNFFIFWVRPYRFFDCI